MLVHGYLGGAAQWAGQVAAFSARTEVLTPELPGFGGRSAETAPDTIGAFAGTVLDALDARGVDRFALLGHSMGGMVAQEIVARVPARVERLVLYATGAVGAMPGRFATFAASRRRIALEGTRATARRIAATWFLDGERAPGYDACAAIAELASADAMRAGLDAMERWSRAGDLARVRCPTLVLWGEADWSYAWPVTERLWRSIPDASLAVVPGCAHAVHLERPALFDALVGDFLARAPRPGAPGAPT